MPCVGVWLIVLEVLVFVAVATNCALIAFTSTIFENTFPHLSAVNILWAVLVFEVHIFPSYLLLIPFLKCQHFVILVRFSIMVLIPDVPERIKRQLAKQKFLKQMAVDSYLQRKLLQCTFFF